MLAHGFRFLMKLPLAKPREICFSSVICPSSSWPISLKKEKKNEVVVGRVLRTQEGACHQCPSKGYVDKASFSEVYELSLGPFCYSFSFFTLPFRNPLPLWYFLDISLSHSVLPSFQGCVILIVVSTVSLHPNQYQLMARGNLSFFCPIIDQVNAFSWDFREWHNLIGLIVVDML